MPEAKRRIDARGSAASLLIYLALAIGFLGRGLFGHFTDRFFGQSTDPSFYLWYFRWWPYAIGHRLNPFFTRLVYAPDGVSLAWSTLIPLPSLIAAPLQHFVGPYAALSMLCLIQPPLAAFSAYLLCRRITGSFWPSLLGGFIFGFSAYMLGQVVAHLPHAITFPLPLAVLLALELFDGTISQPRFATLLAILLVVEFLCSVELAAMATFFGAIAFILALALFRGEDRARLGAMIAPAAVAYAIAALILAPYIYNMLAPGVPGHPLWEPSRYSADLLNFVVPTPANWLGANRWTEAISDKFTAYTFENGAYMGIPLIVVAEAYRRNFWHTPAGKLIVAMVPIPIVCALGPVLHVGGRFGLPMPWAAAAHLPLLESALPARFPLYAFLALAIMTACWFAWSGARLAVKYLAAITIFVSLLPNLSAGFWVTPDPLPSFFSDGTYQRRIAPNEIILALPFSQNGYSMLWQSSTDMYFRMAGGWTGPIPFEYTRLPIVSFFMGGYDLPDARLQLAAFVTHFGVDAIVVDARDARLHFWKEALDAINIKPVSEGGVLFYRIPPGSFPGYAKLSALDLESRAAEIRMDTIISAVDSYLDSRDVATLSRDALAAAALIPHDWRSNPDPWATRNFGIFPEPDQKVAIAIRGSYDALSPLAARYRNLASRIDYPYGTPWSPTPSPTDRSAIRFMVFEFSREQLKRAAEALRGPQPERDSALFPATTASSSAPAR